LAQPARPQRRFFIYQSSIFDLIILFSAKKNKQDKALAQIASHMPDLKKIATAGAGGRRGSSLSSRK
jgi:hypothetical protein